MYYFQASNGSYVSFIKILLGFQLSVELNLLKPLYVHTDHSGTFDNYNARLKFPSHSSALMKNPIRWGASYFRGGNVYGGSLCFRVYFFSYW